MNMYDADNNLVKYGSAEEIIKAHALARVDLYKKRIVHEIKCLESDNVLLRNKVRFVRAVVAEQIKVSNVKKAEFRELLRKLNFYDHDDMNYLLKMEVYSLTLDEVEKLENALKRRE